MAMWVFGYGSLLWNPEFSPTETVLATLKNYHRSFCMLSIHHRGTVEHPGLVLALDEKVGEDCAGLAMRVAPEDEGWVLDMLRERELVSAAYVEKTLPIALSDGRREMALCYVIDPHHDQYCQYALEKQAQMIASAVGGRGPNAEYLFNTAAHLEELGIPDPDLAWLGNRVREIMSR